MSSAGWLFGASCLLAAGALILWDRHQVRRTMDTLEQMLDAAQNGHFSEADFDETRLSALESRFSHYLTSCSLTQQGLAQEKDRIKELISDISHQTKTPLAGLLLQAELLRETELSPDTQECANTLYLQAEKLRFLIDSLIKLSRLENGIITPTPQLGPLQPMLEAAIQPASAKARRKGLALTLTPTTAWAWFDPRWTGEALGNLVDNAIKYTPGGSVTLDVVCYELFVCVRVTDTGIGIPEEEQAAVFSRFYRGAQAADQPGVGIGLYLTRQILHQQGGYLRLSSQPGKGSMFGVYLPAHKVPSANLSKP